MQPDTPREVKEQDVCVGCTMFPTKPKEGITEKAEKIAEEVIFLFTKKRCGYFPNENDTPAIVFQCLMLLDKTAADYELRLRLNTFEALKLSLGIKAN